jgi:hypothetical protein
MYAGAQDLSRRVSRADLVDGLTRNDILYCHEAMLAYWDSDKFVCTLGVLVPHEDASIVEVKTSPRVVGV